ncbi:hypothetical protein VIGAN_03128100 [Vigna angularis var. angularis]|uniref:Uncharacterized protein n=1 Tax=Vigna angularis var. angularis TaxID=157739 RepID=A0A0S3RM05_PHAAN|nr:hypothetical protein VIGAN_03128100 [Vigna angularis var. angularis]
MIKTTTRPTLADKLKKWTWYLRDVQLNWKKIPRRDKHGCHMKKLTSSTSSTTAVQQPLRTSNCGCHDFIRGENGAATECWNVNIQWRAPFCIFFKVKAEVHGPAR